MNYEIARFLSDEDVQDLLRCWNSLPQELWHQFYNLFDVDKRPVPGNVRKKHPAFAKIEKAANSPLMSHYFLQYGQGSFTRFHTDDADKVIKTIVTQIHTSSDLVGGLALVQIPYMVDARPSNKQVKRSKDPEKNNLPPLREQIVPKVVNVRDGESMVYGKELIHGVSQVERGTRMVLVSWFMED